MIVVPASADANVTNITPEETTPELNPIITETTQVSPVTTTTTIEIPATTTVPMTTLLTGTTVEITPYETIVTTVFTTATTTETITGDISVASSPTGAAILVDGVYRGTTPGNVTGLATGTHMLQLELSGYTNYEGTIYVTAGQSTPTYGTLHPMGGASPQIILATAQTTATTIAPVSTQLDESDGMATESPFENPTVLAALIGIVTACIGAGVTLFTHNAGQKKEEKKEKP
jgi:hypothetical protein